MVPTCGNLMVGPAAVLVTVSRSQAGMAVRLWTSTRTVHVSIDGQQHQKTLPSRSLALTWHGCVPMAHALPNRSRHAMLPGQA